MLNQEPIRLIIWDLDETFWRGTLSENGIQEYIQEHHEIILALAKRGIISSICSKNDYASAQKILQEKGIWDYFILPSIDWTPKGPRLKSLIEDIQLRPESVLFIDDHPSNRAEAAVLIPGLQIADEKIIKTLLKHERCQGKDDTQLTRLKQYQLLQRRKVDEKAAGTDNKLFLRASNIRVTIITDITPHIERAIELINRTNQLNFTKNRLPDDPPRAKKEFLTVANLFFNQTGLIHVKDDYGDYGLCGIYVVHHMNPVKKILHFCFSCRILGMQIEKWLYEKLDKPDICIQGDTASQLTTYEAIDWINTHVQGKLQFAEKIESGAPLSKKNRFPEIRLHGGCELEAMLHYLMQETENLISKTNYINGAFLVRRNCTTNLALSLLPSRQHLKQELVALGLKSDDFDPSFFDAPPGALFIISTWGDLYLPVYKHKKHNFEISIYPTRNEAEEVWIYDLTTASPEAIQKYLNFYKPSAANEAQFRQITHHLSSNYTFIGLISEENLYRHWYNILTRIPKTALIAIILPSCLRGEKHANKLALRHHAIMREVIQQFSNVITIDTTRHIRRPEDIQGTSDHLDRMIYFKLYQELIEKFTKKNNYDSPGKKRSYDSLDGI